MSEDEEIFETVPTFYPSLKEMQDFNKYLSYLHKQGVDKVGLCKIVPPSNWGWNPSIEKAREMRVRSPITQCVTGRSGLYSVCNIENGDLSLAEYEKKSKEVHGIPKDFSTQEACYDVERKFWKSLTTTAVPPLYGSDVEGSLFEDADVPFNVNQLDCLLKKCGVRVPGITNPMMYVGMWRSFFPIHTEDVNMFSVNVLHLGAPKFWYGVPPGETKRVESLAKGQWPDEKCSELLRHKTKMFSPMRLKQAGISFVRGVQKQGEIMITWPSSFHAGFNAGFNVAEAVNFVPDSLADLFFSFAECAGFCKCRPDSVVVDVDWLKEQVTNYREGKDTEIKQEHQEVESDLFKQEQQEAEDDLLPVSAIYPQPKPGDWLDVVTIVDGIEIRAPFCVEAVVDDFVRLHEKDTPRKNDLWLSLRSKRLRKCLNIPTSLKRKKNIVVVDDDLSQEKRTQLDPVQIIEENTPSIV